MTPPKKEKIVFVLTNEEGIWYQIKEKELKKWLEDGSIKKNDLIVYPSKILEAKHKEEIKLKSRR